MILRENIMKELTSRIDDSQDLLSYFVFASYKDYDVKKLGCSYQEVSQKGSYFQLTLVKVKST